MPRFLFLIIYVALLSITLNAYAIKKNNRTDPNTLQCAAFSPYVGELNPNYGTQPSKEFINELLDELIKDTPFRCIMTYGVLNGLDNIFNAAKVRGIKVIAIIWLDNDIKINSQSIAKGIEVAKAFPDTIIKISCGSEVRTRHAYAFDNEIIRCINDLHNAGVDQPITTIDTWWEWCNQSLICQKNTFASKVDWIGVNIFPWWENKFSGIHTCITAEKAADFHIARLADIHQAYPEKEVILTEFGWPNGPNEDTNKKNKSGQDCGIANYKNQRTVIESTFKKLREKNWSGVVFEAFSENWKTSEEGQNGRYWGLCQMQPSFTCTKKLNFL